MPLGLGGALAIGAGASLLGAGLNAGSQANLNRRNIRQQNKWRAEDRAWSLEDWEATNAEYDRRFAIENDKKASVQRHRDAGLNPALLNSGSTSQSPTTSTRDTVPTTGTPATDVVPIDVDSVVDGLNVAANTSRTIADTNRINQVAEGQGLENFIQHATTESQVAASFLQNIQTRVQIQQAFKSMEEADQRIYRSSFDMYMKRLEVAIDIEQFERTASQTDRSLDQKDRSLDQTDRSLDIQNRNVDILSRLSKSQAGKLEADIVNAGFKPKPWWTRIWRTFTEAIDENDQDSVDKITPQINEVLEEQEMHLEYNSVTGEVEVKRLGRDY